MIDYKYLVITITAIFMALTAGILIGMQLSKQETAQSLTSRAVQSLSNQLKEVMAEDQAVRAENTQLEKALDIREQFERDVMPAIVSGRLTGKRIAVILAGSHRDAGFLQGLIKAVEIAGGDVVSTTLIKDRLLPARSDAKLELLLRFGIAAKDEPLISMELARAYARAVVLGEAPKGLERAARLSAGLVIDGDYSSIVDAAVVISCAQTDRKELVESGNSIEAGILSGIREAGVRVVACETDGPHSVTQYLHKKGVTTVDCVDRVPGQIGLILALEGARGSFGMKPGATRVIPPLEVTSQ